jgi:hypothetical protein
MSTKRAQFNLSFTGSEEFTAAEVPGAGTVSERTLKVGAGNTLANQVSETGTPLISGAPVSLTVTIAGPITLDFTALAAAVLPPSATRTVDMTGKKLIGMHLRAKSDNAAVITVTPGTDPYPIFGTAKDIDVPPGASVALCFRDVASSLPAVAAGVKDVDFSGTNDDVLYVDLFFGT